MVFLQSNSYSYIDIQCTCMLINICITKIKRKDKIDKKYHKAISARTVERFSHNQSKF